MSEYNCKIIIVDDLIESQTYIPFVYDSDKGSNHIIVPLYREGSIDEIERCIEAFIDDQPEKEPHVHIVFDTKYERTGICITDIWMKRKRKTNAN